MSGDQEVTNEAVLDLPHGSPTTLKASPQTGLKQHKTNNMETFRGGPCSTMDA